MDEKLITNFLVKSTIPKQQKNKYPNNINNKRLWDAIYRAHRDVLTGRVWLPKYCKNFGSAQNNEILKHLYEKILENDICYSGLLISQLLENRNVEYGAIQKLVNMTLKYILILNTFEDDFEIKIDESKCDCPVDSIILNELKGKHPKWTQIENEKQYNNIQNEIKTGLRFDFEKWQKDEQ